MTALSWEDAVGKRVRVKGHFGEILLMDCVEGPKNGFVTILDVPRTGLPLWPYKASTRHYQILEILPDEEATE